MPATDRLDPDRISTNLKTDRVGRKVLVFDRTASTNDVAAEYARNPENDGVVVFAEEQTAGRGRRGDAWFSPHGESLLFSIALVGRVPDGEMLSLSAAVAVAEAIGRVGGHHARIKWPNDVLLNGKKIVGILVESKAPRRGDSLTPNCSVIGIGINCHQSRESFAPEIREIATSIDIESGSPCDRTILARRVLTSLDHWWTVAQSDPERVTETWGHLSAQVGHRVAVRFNRRRFAGHCIGVDPTKGLILRLDGGGIRMFDAAHTTIAKP
jgi:BirA family transcriptional regulator, biotin operon repressor / biotin---[acetyl-CoA-carboxylase] ligase